MPRRSDINSILIIGAGPIIIGQACEFDYSGTQAAKAFAQIAVDARGAQDGSAPADAFYSRPSRVAGRPLQLWAYEASPFCALVRETLSELEISYVLQP